MPLQPSQLVSEFDSNAAPVLPHLKGREVHKFNGVSIRTYQSIDEIPQAEADAFFAEYFTSQQAIYERVMGTTLDVRVFMNAFWGHIELVLPPQGSYYLAWAEDGALVGSGALRRVDDVIGEMKHLYVSPAARRTGLGRWLVERRIADARALGYRTLIADTLRSNVAMPMLYAKLGFEETPPNQLGASVNLKPEVAAALHFFRKDL